jgi:hypothetical protein
MLNIPFIYISHTWERHGTSKREIEGERKNKTDSEKKARRSKPTRKERNSS